MRVFKEIGFMILAVAGVISALAFSMVNMFIPAMVNDIHIAIANGVSINEFSKLILGVNMNGKIRFIDMNIAAALSILSLLLAYIGTQGFLLSRKGLSLRHLVSKKYWSFFNWSFSYSVRLRKDASSK